MDKINLTGKTLQYLAARLGATELWGFNDAFQDETEEEIKQDFIHIQEELIEQHFADMNFDGVFQVSDDVNEVIRVCTAFDRYISSEVRDRNKTGNNRLFFSKGTATVKLEAEDDLVSIIPIDASDIPNEIMSLHPNPVWLESGGASVLISLSDLAGAKRGKKSEQLIKKGCTKEIAEALSEGLAENSVINTMVVLERKGGEIKMRSHTLMFVPNGTLLLTITDDSATDDVQVEPVTEATWRDQLTQILLRDDDEAE